MLGLYLHITYIGFMVSVQLLDRTHGHSPIHLCESRDKSLLSNGSPLGASMGKNTESHLKVHAMLHYKKKKENLNLKWRSRLFVAGITYLGFEGKEYNFCSGLFL